MADIQKKEKRRVKHTHRREKKEESRARHHEKMKAKKHVRKGKSKPKQGRRDR